MKFQPSRVFIFLAVFLLIPAAIATAQSVKIGKTLAEIEKLGNKEGSVRIASSWRRTEVKKVVKKFNALYPKIKVEQTRASGIQTRERILNEAIAGVVEYDLVNVSGELRNQYIKAGVVVPIEWKKLYPDVKPLHFSPKGYFVATGFSRYVIAYNPTMVPPERVPKDWNDCLDPYWKGKFVVITRPRTFTGLYAAWGEEKTIDFAKKLRANKPVWRRSQSGTLAQVLAGEYAMVCGVGFHTLWRTIRRDSSAPLKYVIPSVLPFQAGEALSVMKGGKSPNASILLTGYLVSPKGQESYSMMGRSSPLVEGTVANKVLKETGAKMSWGAWDVLDYEADVARKIIAAWGFPKVTQ